MRKEDIEQLMENIKFPLVYAENRNMIFDKNGRIIFDLRRDNYFRRPLLSGEFMVEALNIYAKIYEAGKTGEELRIRMHNPFKGVLLSDEPVKSKF